MTAPTPAAADTGLGVSWLASAPDRAVVIRREISEYVIKALLDGHFSALGKGKRRREWFDTRLISEQDTPLLAAGARFWLVAESYRGRPGTACTGIALRRPGVAAEQAFTDRRGGAR